MYLFVQECPEAVHQLMLDTWQKDRKNRPKFSAVRNTLDRLMQSPDLLRKLAKPVNQSMIDPEMPNIASQLTVSQWLQLIKMDRYTEAFAQKGVHNMEQVSTHNNSSAACGGIPVKHEQILYESFPPPRRLLFMFV